MLVGIGANTYGELGLNHSKKVRKLNIINNKLNVQNIDIHCGNDHIIYADYKNQLFWAAGHNKHGQCAVDVLGNDDIKKKLNDFSDVSDDDISYDDSPVDMNQMMFGYYSSGSSDSDGCDHLAFEPDENVDNIHILQQITYFKQNNIMIKKVCTTSNDGPFNTFWISSKHKLYANGDNSLKNLGIQQKDYRTPILVPELIGDLSNVIDARGSRNYSIVLCQVDNKIIVNYWIKNNMFNINLLSIPNDIINAISIFYGIISNVYSTPTSSRGGDGQGPRDWSNINYSFRKIALFNNKQIVKIGTGYLHSLFLDIYGRVYSCGANTYGQLGILQLQLHWSAKPFKVTDDIRTPQLIEYFVDNKIIIKEIECGSEHNLAIDINNNVYSWGTNSCGECGHGIMTKGIRTPKLIPRFKNVLIKEIKCGSHHSYVGTMNNEHYLFGNNPNKECIKSKEKYVTSPYLINKEVCKTFGDNKLIKEIHLSGSNTILKLLDSDSSLAIIKT